MNSYSAGMGYVRFYGLIFLISVLFGAFYNMNKTRKKWYVLTTFFIFFIVMAFKNFNMGKDTMTYVTYFKQISLYEHPAAYIETYDLEAGYVWLNWVIAKCFGDVRALFIIYAAFISISIGRFVYKYVEVPGIFVCLFLGLTQYDFFLSVQRQAIAIAIFLYAFDSLVKQKKLKYLILCGIATLFHYTAVIMLLIYPLISSKKIESAKTSNTKTIFLLAGVTIFATVFLDKIVDVIISIHPKYEYYIGSEFMDGEPRLAVFLKMAVYLLLLCVPKLFGTGTKTGTDSHNKGERLSMLNIAIMIISSSATAFMRFSPVFNLYANMHFSNTASKVDRDNRMPILMFAILFSFLFGLTVTVLKTPEWQTTYPIKLQF